MFVRLDFQVFGSLGKNVGRCAHETEHKRSNGDTGEGEDNAQKKGQKHGGMNGAADLPAVAGAVALGNHHAAAGGHAAEKADQRIDDRADGTNGRQRFLADKVAYDYRVYSVIKLLKKGSHQYRQKERYHTLPYDALRDTAAVK